MSRRIDTTQPLSNDDIAYLRDRNRLPKNYTRADGASIEPEVPEAQPYMDMKVVELREELNNRGLNTEGRKQELVDRLAQHDEDRAEF